MRVWSFLISIILMGASPIAEAQVQQMEQYAGGTSDDPQRDMCISRCFSNLGGAQRSCKNSGNAIDIGKCNTGGSLMELCIANACMERLGYSHGMNTSPADYCMPKCPPTKNVGPVAQDDEEEVVEESNNIPIPTPAPRQRTTTTTTTTTQTTQQPKRQTAQTTTQTQPQQATTSTAQWPQESSQDIQQCSSFHSQANLCCNQPMNCSSELTESQQNSYLQMARAAQSRGDSAGLHDICRQSRVAGSSSSNLNTGFANICYAKHSSCTQTCSTALTKWQERLNNCGSGCDRSLVSQTVSTLQQKQQSCQSYAGLENRIRSQSFASAEDASLAQLCEERSRSETASTDGNNSNGGGGGWGNLAAGAAGAASAALPLLSGQPSGSSYDEGSGSGDQNVCSLNPNAPGCYNPVAESDNSSGFSNPSGGSTGSDSFNVGSDNNFQSGDMSGNTYQPNGSIEPQAAQGHVVPNGGGAMPGGAGQSAGSNHNGQDLPPMLGSGVNPNVLEEGLQGGSGYSQGAAGSGFEFRNRYGGVDGSGLKPQSGGKNYKGLDLKKYLPGGSEDPRRQLAGISDFHPDIGPKHIDFFLRVSTRLQTLCKLKRLLDCQ